MSSGTDFNDRFVTLRNGPIVPAAAYVLLLDFERRGVEVRRDGDALVVGPRHLVTDDDREQLRRWKYHLLGLLEYCDRPDSDAHLFTISAVQTPGGWLRDRFTDRSTYSG